MFAFLFFILIKSVLIYKSSSVMDFLVNCMYMKSPYGYIIIMVIYLRQFSYKGFSPLFLRQSYYIQCIFHGVKLIFFYFNFTHSIFNTLMMFNKIPLHMLKRIHVQY